VENLLANDRAGFDMPRPRAWEGPVGPRNGCRKWPDRPGRDCPRALRRARV